MTNKTFCVLPWIHTAVSNRGDVLACCYSRFGPDSGVIRKEIPDFVERRFYICGPPAMVEAMKKILQDELAVSKENVITENFTGY